MTETDYEKFATMWANAWESVGRKITPGGIELAFDLLADKNFVDVSRGVVNHLRKNSSPPTAAAIVELLGDPMARLTADEAWALCPRSESETVVWPEEAVQAFAVASIVLETGDDVGARMAFRSAYNRVCQESDAKGAPVVWRVSLGHDVAGRESAIQAAVERGRLSAERARLFLPAKLSADQGPIIALLAGGPVKAPKDAKPELLARLEDCRLAVAAGAEARAAKRKNACGSEPDV